MAGSSRSATSVMKLAHQRIRPPHLSTLASADLLPLRRLLALHRLHCRVPRTKIPMEDLRRITKRLDETQRTLKLFVKEVAQANANVAADLKAIAEGQQRDVLKGWINDVALRFFLKKHVDNFAKMYPFLAWGSLGYFAYKVLDTEDIPLREYPAVLNSARLLTLNRALEYHKERKNKLQEIDFVHSISQAIRTLDKVSVKYLANGGGGGSGGDPPPASPDGPLVSKRPQHPVRQLQGYPPGSDTSKTLPPKKLPGQRAVKPTLSDPVWKQPKGNQGPVDVIEKVEEPVEVVQKCEEPVEVVKKSQ